MFFFSFCRFVCRRKYKFQQFVCDPQFSCPLLLNSKRGADKRHQQQTASRHGLGHAFRNSWRKKDSSDNKGPKKMVCLLNLNFKLTWHIYDILLLLYRCFSSSLSDGRGNGRICWISQGQYRKRPRFSCS
jgi:hypothetical protein